ncbi:class I SAM-dependent methyltransferase [Phaeobacter italicus]|uniref:class I SAM-dependent methyltransferase n=1 Tax=Phaeobacter italicus TaxID=481446 RepID=UPI001CD67602|nr:class I SAM-dependent methyltransferase [Phaeobacter italicus]MCA0857911.1 class I SAM-dependent methyltransferase [Phaeobacter italicus]
MNDWTSGYVAEIGYTYDFFHAMTPTRMGLAALSKGVQHPFGRETFSYCELGCGQGFTANVIAAANPHIDVHAMDFNPAHIAEARALAEQGGVQNVHFYERSFADFAGSPGLPSEFDVIALHGILSWVSRDNQKLVYDFIAKHLKPGGVVYASFNTQPGWAAAMPMRRILTDHAERGSGPLEKRIDDAIAFAETLRKSGADFFAYNPDQVTRLTKMRAMPRNYLAHEFFNKDWTPFHFADVAADMGQAKLDYLGAANLLDQMDELCMSKAQLEILDNECDQVRRESLRDVMLNEQFRADLFVKGGVPFTERGAVGAWFATPFALARRYSTGPVKMTWRGLEVDMAGLDYDPVLQKLSEGPATVRDLLAQGLFGAMQWADITRMMKYLVGAGFIVPCLPLDGIAERSEGCRQFNLAVCKQSEETQKLSFLASPVTGGGVAVDRMEQLFLLARSEGHETPENWALFAWQILAPQGQRLEQDGKVLETAEENIAVLQVRAQSFAARRVRVLEQLGISLLPIATEQEASVASSAAA